jgi:3-oxoacyl-[acyl-carrier protein] reductase
MTFDFSGKSALVVGGSSGIGRGVSRAFRDAGASVVVWGTRPSVADYEDSDELAGMAYFQVDVSDAERIRALTAEIESLDILVMSQGTVLYDRQEFEIEAFRKVVEVNLTSMMTCAQGLYGVLRASRGVVITVSSTAAYHATRGNPAYNASKCGVVGLTRTLGQAWAGRGIRVNGIAPGYVDTKLTKVTTEHPERKAAAIASIPLGRFGNPADMAGAALFLASPYSSYIVGQTLVVDGGMTL